MLEQILSVLKLCNNILPNNDVGSFQQSSIKQSCCQKDECGSKTPLEYFAKWFPCLDLLWCQSSACSCSQLFYWLFGTWTTWVSFQPWWSLQCLPLHATCMVVSVTFYTCGSSYHWHQLLWSTFHFIRWQHSHLTHGELEVAASRSHPDNDSTCTLHTLVLWSLPCFSWQSCSVLPLELLVCFKDCGWTETINYYFSPFFPLNKTKLLAPFYCSRF